VVVGGSGNDLLFGGEGADLLVGGAGDDVLVGGRGGDTLRGGAGADLYAFGAADFAAGEVDFVEGFESGVDRLEFSGFAGLAAFADLDVRALGPSLLIALPDGGGVVLRDFAGPLTEADVVFADAPRAPGGAAEPGVVRLGDGAERFITTHGEALEVFTGAGVDVVVAGAGDDALRAGEGAKVLIGGAGDDTLFVGPSGANLTGGQGADRFVFSAADTSESGLLVDFIEDFESGVDQVALDGFAAIQDADALAFRPLGADLALTLADNRLVVFRGVATADQLDDGDFLFG
jgi:Ca2+-binding RTX toxin-like protein